MTTLLVALNLLAAVSALVAAYYWYRSAATDLPPLVAYWGQAPATDPFFSAIQSGVRFNRMAAGFSAASAALWAVATVLQVASAA